MDIDNKWLILLIPLGVGLLLLLSEDQKQNPNPSEGKEAEFLRYNKDRIFQNMLDTEEHFQNINKTNDKSNGSCCIKHMASCASHCREAVSHALVIEGEEKSQKFQNLHNNVRDFLHDVKADAVTPSQGIERIRHLRHNFESFNPEFNISKCEACQIQ